MVGRCQRKTRLQREGGDPNVILRDGRSSLAELSGDAPVNLRSGLVGGKHVHCFQEPGDLLEVLFRTSGTESACVKFGESRLRQVKFLLEAILPTNALLSRKWRTPTLVSNRTLRPGVTINPVGLHRPLEVLAVQTRRGQQRGTAAFVALGIEAVDVTGHFHQIARRKFAQVTHDGFDHSHVG